MTRILVGTASWTDPSLVKCGRFYPPGCSSAEARLRYYASQFPLVEVNSSYYALPSRHNAELWVQRTPAAFRMNVKAFRLFTGHQTPPDALPLPVQAGLSEHKQKNVYYKDVPPALLDEMWAQFRDALEPLRAAGKLGAVHFQFAPWLTCSSAARAHIEECRARLPGYLLSVEFRHQSWFNESHLQSTLSMEGELQLVHVVVDEPQGFSNSVGSHWAVTNPHLAVVRLHGRNASTWNIKGAASAAERFNYDYPISELRDIADHVTALAGGVAELHVVFNNNFEDQGQRNAATLMQMLHLSPSPAAQLDL